MGRSPVAATWDIKVMVSCDWQPLLIKSKTCRLVYDDHIGEGKVDGASCVREMGVSVRTNKNNSRWLTSGGYTAVHSETHRPV